jgi:predicted DsbA family dithiol-disulfide isomerase
MKIEIWSDVMCPFCYLGKHKFEAALQQFADKQHIEIEWKAFQLNPELQTNPDISIHQYLADAKGMSLDQARQSGQYLTNAGKAYGLDYHFDDIVVANTFKAQQLIKLAHQQGKGNEMEERLFEAYFSEGKNVDDLPTLLQLAGEAGLHTDGLTDALANNQFTAETQKDIEEARQLNIHGVPFFVFNRKYAINGAQEPSVFLETLIKSFADWAKDQPGIKPTTAPFSYKPQ